MVTPPKVKEQYTLAKCCRPSTSDAIAGYYSFDNILKVHRSECPNLDKTDPQRLVSLLWADILAPEDIEPDRDFYELEDIDFAVLRHHRDYDIDYSLKVAAVLRIDQQEAFERHQKLTDLGFLERVPAVMVRYRRTTADKKWIKHRNHTYYRLTEKGRSYLEHRESGRR